jgi:hypothetical protein
VSPKRVRVSLHFAIIFYVMACIYYSMSTNSIPLYLAPWQNKTSVDIYFVPVSFALIGLYRWSKSQDMRELVP